MTFEKLGLSESVLRGVRAVGYTVPTEIQALAIPHALTGADVIGRAKTGSGKTAAFILPTIDRLLAGGGRSPNGVRALVLTPTRELAQQVADATFTYARHLKLRGDAIYGGVGIEPQFKRLRHGVDILAATPGRLLDHIERGSVDLSHCEVLIVDEADRMFDMGFINDVKRIIAKIPKQRQTLLFSATMSKEVRTLTASIMKEPAYVEIGVEGNPAESVRQHFFSVPKQDKFDFLAHLLKDDSAKMESVLVFSRTKHGANKIAKRLTRAGVVTGVLHSDRSQSQRQQALDSFKQGRLRVLIATDIAARGIDVVGISHVINFDTPNFAEDYVHRIGRTGRADATGDAITFVASDEKDHLRRIERFVGRRYDMQSPPKNIVRMEADFPPANGTAAPHRSDEKRNGRSDSKREQPRQKRGDAGSRQDREFKRGNDRGFKRDENRGEKRSETRNDNRGEKRPDARNENRGDKRFETRNDNRGNKRFEKRGANGNTRHTDARNGNRAETLPEQIDGQIGRDISNESAPFGGHARYGGGKKRPAPHRKTKGGAATTSKTKGKGRRTDGSAGFFSSQKDTDGRRRDPRFA
jgi:ATP-dependent RNA helicase RhlE